MQNVILRCLLCRTLLQTTTFIFTLFHPAVRMFFSLLVSLLVLTTSSLASVVRRRGTDYCNGVDCTLHKPFCTRDLRNIANERCMRGEDIDSSVMESMTLSSDRVLTGITKYRTYTSRWSNWSSIVPSLWRMDSFSGTLVLARWGGENAIIRFVGAAPLPKTTTTSAPPTIFTRRSSPMTRVTSTWSSREPTSHTSSATSRALTTTTTLLATTNPTSYATATSKTVEMKEKNYKFLYVLLIVPFGGVVGLLIRLFLFKRRRGMSVEDIEEDISDGSSWDHYVPPPSTEPYTTQDLFPL